MAPRPLTSIFMAPPPPSRLTASGGVPTPVPGSTTPTYNAAFPGLPVTTLPEGGISILVPTTGEPEPILEPEPAPVWMPKARQGLGIGAVGKSSVWDVITGPAGQSTPASNSSSNSRPVSRMPSGPKSRSQTGESAEHETMSDSGVAPPRKRHIPRNPLDPHRLALISNALGVSMPLPTRSVLQTKSRDLESRGRQASLDDVRPANNHYHARNMSLISFRSNGGSPSPNPRGSPVLSVSSRRNLASANSQVSTFTFTTPSQPTRFLLHVYPPPHMPSIHPFATRSPPPGYHSQFRRGTLVPLHATLSGQLSAVAKEYGLPSTNGMFVYLLGADFEPPEDDDEDYPAPRDDRTMGPRIGEEAWKMLWASLLRADRDEFMRSYNPNDGSAMGSPASGVTALGEESPPTNAISISPKSSHSSFAPRPLRTVAAMNSREGLKGIMSASSASGQPPLSVSSPSSGTGTASTALSRNPSLATESRSNTSSPTTTLSTNPAVATIMPALPIVGKIEFDIDMRRAPWYAKFCTRAEQLLAQRRLPSRVNTPVGPLATPAPHESRAPSPITLTLPPRGRSVSPGMDESGIGSTASLPIMPGSPGGGKFPKRLQLPSNPLNARGDRGLLSPHDAMLTPTSPAGSMSGWPAEGGEDEMEDGGLGLELSPSSSTVADGALEGVVAEGYAPLEGDEDESTSFSFQTAGETSMVSGDPLGDVFPDEPWSGGARGVGIEGLPPTRNEEIDDEDGELPPVGAEEEVEDVKNLWNENNRPSLALSPPGHPDAEPTAVTRAAAASSQVIFPRPAPSRQRSDSMKRPPPLKLAGGTEAEENPSDQNLPSLSPGQEQTNVEDDEMLGSSIIVIGEDGQADWTWRSSEHVRKERLDELEKALAQLSPRILEPPPPEFDRPRSPGLHHRMLSSGSARGARPDPHAPLFMSEELSNLRASMAAKGNSSPTGSASSTQNSPSWPAVPFATQAQTPSSIPHSPRFPETPRDADFLEIPGMSAPMTAESRIRMQAEQMRLDLANLPPPETAPPRPRRPQTPVTLNSPPVEDSPPLPSHQRSRFSIDSTGDETIGVPMTRERSNSIMSVKGIRKLWRGRNSTQNLNGKGGDMPPPIPASPNPNTLGFSRDSVLPPGTPSLGTQSLAPGHSRQSSASQAQSAQVSAVKGGVVHKRDSSNSGKDPFRFDQEPKGQARSTSPSYLSDSTATGSTTKEKEKATTRGILKKWSSKAKKADGEDSAPSRPQSRQQNALSPKKGPLNGLGGSTHSSRGSVSSINTLTAGGLQADMPSRPSVSSSLASDAEPMTPRMSQFEMVAPPQNPS